MKYLILFHFFILAFASVTFSNDNITLTGNTITDVCYGFSCHGPIAVEYELSDSRDNLIIRSKSNYAKEGQFSVTNLSAGQLYLFKIIDPGFLNFKSVISIPGEFSYNQISKDILVYPKANNVEIFLHIPPFENHKTRVRIGIESYLDDFITLIKSNPDVMFEIVCFPDDNTNEENNMELTSGRGFNLMNYFIKQGITEGQIFIRSNKNTDPKNPPYDFKTAKGKNYIGSTYLILKLIK